MDEMARRIKQKRNELGFTMQELADKVGVNRAAVSKWESGMVSNIPRNRIALLSKALECSPAWLMGIDTENKNYKDGVNDANILLKIKKLPAEGRKELESYLEFLLSKYGA